MSGRLTVVALTAWLCCVSAAEAADVKGALDFARKTLRLVERDKKLPKLAAELKHLEDRYEQAKADRKRTDDNRYHTDILALRRRIILSHPSLDFRDLLVNKRTASIPGHMCDQYYGRHSRPDVGLVVIENWRDRPKDRPLLAGKLSGSVRHPDLSFDGKKALFGFSDHSKKVGGQQRGFFIYEVRIDGKGIRQLTGTARDKFVGMYGRQTALIEDYDPCYLPDGGFAFISTRSQQFGRCHGSRYVPAYVLYRADADGSNITQLSFNEANEWDPSVLRDGRIIYTRWDYINRHDTNFQSLWVTRPDGTGVSHFYGNYSIGPCMIAEARAVPGSHKVVATATDHHGYTAGSIIVIDPNVGEDGGKPLLNVTPEIGFPERSAPKGTTYAARPFSRGGGGRAATPFPLTEELFLVAYPHGGRMAIVLVDTLGGREVIYADGRNDCFAPIPVRPVVRPPVMASHVAGHQKETTGRFFVQDVYRSRQPIERGTIKAMRINAIISQPTRSKPKLSRVANEVIKKVLGTVTVADDGSVAFEAPAGTPLQLQLLDANGMAVMTMRSLIYAMGGEIAGCVGCHEPRSSAPVAIPQRPGMTFQKIRPAAGPKYEGGLSFARTVQPVLDRYCIKCHGLGKTEKGVNLLGERTTFNRAYDSLARSGLVAMAHRNSETYISKPKDYFAHRGKLAAMLLAGHPDKAGKGRVKLDRESFQRIADWLDLNGQYFGDYSFNRLEHRSIDGGGEKALRAAIEQRFGAELARQPLAALINIALPRESRILLTPLAVKAGGWGQLTRGGWASTSDPSYRRMVKLVEGAIRPLSRTDIAGTCGSGAKGRGCSCGVCWVRGVRAQRTGLAATRK